MGGKESNIQETEHWFIGENRDVYTPVVDAAGAAVTLTGMTIRWVLYDRKNGTALITKASPVFTDDAGTADRATVTVLTGDYTLVTRGGTYYYEWQRTDSGEEAVLAFGRAPIADGGVFT